MPASTPIARSKTAALTRINDAIPKGYRRYTGGSVAVAKAASLAVKFHALYGIGCTPAQRLTRRAKGLANSLLVMYWPEGAERVEWLLLATAGNGLEKEKLQEVTDKPRLAWLDYELVRYAKCGAVSWTWRRPKQQMMELHAFLSDQLNKRHYSSVADMLVRLARQPGFHGIREQSKALIEEAQRRGYTGEVPHLFYVQKVSHGDRLVLTEA